MLLNLILPTVVSDIDLDGRPSYEGGGFMHCRPDRACRSPPPASSEDILFWATSDADTVTHCPIGLGWS